MVITYYDSYKRLQSDLQSEIDDAKNVALATGISVIGYCLLRNTDYSKWVTV